MDVSPRIVFSCDAFSFAYLSPEVAENIYPDAPTAVLLGLLPLAGSIVLPRGDSPLLGAHPAGLLVAGQLLLIPLDLRLLLLGLPLDLIF